MGAVPIDVASATMRRARDCVIGEKLMRCSPASADGGGGISASPILPQFQILLYCEGNAA